MDEKNKALRLAEKYMQRGNITAAIAQYFQAVEQDPEDTSLLNTIGDLYVRAGKIPNALSCFSTLADHYCQHGFRIRAVAMLKKILRLSPESTPHLMQLGEIYTIQAHTTEARQLFYQAAQLCERSGDPRQALLAYQRLAELDPGDEKIHIRISELLYGCGEIERAHDSLIMAGAKFYGRGEIEPALAVYLKAMALLPDSCAALKIVAGIHTQQGHYDEAIKLLSRALEKHPYEAELPIALSRAYLMAGSIDQAIRPLRLILRRDKNNIEALKLLAEIFWLRNDQSKLQAVRRLQAAAQKRDARETINMPGEFDASYTETDSMISVSPASDDQPSAEKKIAMLRSMLAKDPDNIQARLKLKEIYTQSGRLDLAATECLQLARINQMC
jgi:tetratricopeptide (TPR) repeat protein